MDRWQEQMDRDAWPAGFDRRQMAHESAFAPPDLTSDNRLRVIQAATIRREVKQAQHERMRAVLHSDVEST